MQKFITAIFIGVFLLSGSIGFGITRQVKALSVKSPQIVAPANQLNILLVRISNRAQAAPRLISVWGFFVSRTEFPSVIMKRLYPDATSETASKLNQTFSLDKDNQPSGKFLETLNGLGLPGLKTAVADESLAVDWLNALAGHPVPGTSDLKKPFSTLEAAQTIDRQLFINVCSGIQNRTTGVNLSSENMHSEIKNSQAIKYSDDFHGWEGLVTSLHLSSCEMLAGQ